MDIVWKSKVKMAIMTMDKYIYDGELLRNNSDKECKISTNKTLLLLTLL